MLKPFFSHQVHLAVLCAFNFWRVDAAQNFTITVDSTPSVGGTVAGAGTFPEGSDQVITVQAAPGWYVYSGEVNPNVAGSGTLPGALSRATRSTTNIQGSLHLTTNEVITVAFVPLTIQTVSATAVINGTTNEGTGHFSANVGDSVAFTAEVAGRPMIFPAWYKDGAQLQTSSSSQPSNYVYVSELANANGFIALDFLDKVAISDAISILTFRSVASSDRGTYSLVVKSDSGSGPSITNTFNLFVPGSVNAYLGPNGGGSFTLITNSTVSFIGSLSVDLRASYVNPLIFYTLDGSTPSFSSPVYTGTLLLTSNSTLRAIAYPTDLSESAELGPITFFKGSPIHIEIPYSPYGIVTLSKDQPFAAGDTITARFDPYGAYSSFPFIGWSGLSTATNPSVSITVQNDGVLRPIIGSVATIVPLGSGTVRGLQTGSVIPLDSVVTLDAMPDPGNSFVQWGGNASGTNSHVEFTATSSNTLITALFAPLPANTFSITAFPEGLGTINVEPQGNSFVAGTIVTLRAVPEADQQFMGWSGAVTNSDNPLAVTMTSNLVLTAQFTSKLVLLLSRTNIGSAPLFIFEMERATHAGYRIEQSANIKDWTVPDHIPALNAGYRPLRQFNSVNGATFFRAVAE